MAEQHIDLHDEKTNEIDHKELAEVDYGLRKSRFDDLSIPRTLWVFRKTVLVVLSVYTGTFVANATPYPWTLAYLPRVSMRRFRGE
jgi:hypothetical protein